MKGKDVEELFEELAVVDVRDACDVLKSVHESACSDFHAKKRRYCDGYVSLEVSPRLARDTKGTVAAALKLNAAVDRSNVMIKIPATTEGIPAITEVLGAGINVNVTLIFSTKRYSEVLDAWMDGIELAQKNGHDLSKIASVASFFVSRVDAAIDALLPEGDARRGTAANAQVAAAYALYLERINGSRAKSLIASGAQVQRPLWDSTSTKNPNYYDLLYVDSLVANEPVNTMPDPTLEGVLDHGDFSTSLLLNAASIVKTASLLYELPSDISLSDVTDKLETDGVQSFIDSYGDLLKTVADKVNG
jgi:transaldolase